MLVLPNAKILLFIAMNVGPHNASNIYAVSKSEAYTWSSSETGWVLQAKSFPASDFTRDPEKTLSFKGNPPQDTVPDYLFGITRQNWKGDAAMVFENGDRVEKKGPDVFYIMNAGGSNERIYTITFPKS